MTKPEVMDLSVLRLHYKNNFAEYEMEAPGVFLCAANFFSARQCVMPAKSASDLTVGFHPITQ